MVRSISGLVFIVVMGCVMPVPADVVINEIMYHPRVDGANGEYVELHNTGTAAVDLSGWRFSEGIDYVFPQGTAIDAGGFLLLCRNEIFLRQFYALGNEIKTVGNYAPSSLSNSGEEIVLEDALGQVVDRVNYNDKAPWPLTADGQGASLELIHPLADNDNVLYWAGSRIPTPGRPNSVLLSAVPPRIQRVSRVPLAPGSQIPVRVSAVFAPDDTLNNVILSYMVNRGVSRTLTMVKQGTAYVAEIPGQAAGSEVEYWITANNASGYPITMPAGSAQSFYYYRVEADPPAPGSIVVNEFMYNNPGPDGEDREWIELYNPAPQAVNLSHWILKDENDNHAFRLPIGTSIPSNGFLLIAPTRDPAWTSPVVEGLTFSLGNKSDAVRLFDPNERLISGVYYNDGSEWPAGADGEGGSLELVQPERTASEPNNWAVSPQGGTPGRPNARLIVDPEYHDYDVVINEIFYHPEDEEYDNNLEKEYVELYNLSSRPVDLSGWRFTDGIEFLFPQGQLIPGNGYLLVCRNTGRYPDVPNKVGNYLLQLSNGGEAVALSNRHGLVIDYVRYNDRPPWPVLADGEGHSLELMVPAADNRLASNWRSGQPYSPGAPNTVMLPNLPPRIASLTHTPRYPAATTSEVRQEEVMAIEVGQVWKYFKGRSQPPSDWKNVDFDDTSWDQGPTGIGYADGDDATILNDMRNNYASVFARKTFTLAGPSRFSGMELGVDYDDGFIAYLNGVEIARGNINGTPRYNEFAAGSHDAGTMEFFNISSFLNLLTEGTNVLAIQVHNNSLGSSDLSLIPQLKLTRELPAGQDESDVITITAGVEDDDGVREVHLHYQRLSSPLGAGLVQGDWKTVRMVDDGTQGDAIAGDGIYTYRLNAAETIRPREIWRYKVSAVDALGLESVYPLQDETTRNAALFVEDRHEKPAFPTVYVFAEREVINWLNRNVDSNQEQPALVVIGGDVYDLYYEGGIRYHGDTDRNKPKKSWRVRFPKGSRWEDQRVINLYANYQDSPLVRGESGFLEHLAYQFMREAGVPAADTQHYRLMVNNSYYGLFLRVEEYNQDFVSRHGLPATTRIYKAGVRARRSYMAREPNFEAYASKYQYTLGREDDIHELVAFIEELNTSEDLKAFFENNLDIEAFLNYLACVAVLTHVDSTEKNYYPTRGADGRWLILPWDMRHSWGELPTNDAFPFVSTINLLDGAEGGMYGINQLRMKFLSIPEFRQRYYQRLRDIVEHQFTPEHLDPLIDAYWSYLQDAVAEDARQWNSPGNLTAMAGEIKKYIGARRAFILADANVRPTGTPPAPANVAPAEGTVVATRQPVLQVSIPSGQTAEAVEWEIQSGRLDFYKPLWSLTTPGGGVSISVPPGVLAAGGAYYWRARYQIPGNSWSEWSQPTSFKTQDRLAPPNVQNVVVTPMDGALRLEWTLPVAPDLIRVDVFQQDDILESKPIHDNRLTVRNLVNGVLYTFVIKTVSVDRMTSPGVTVSGRPFAPIVEGNTIAYFRFEGDASDTNGLFPDGQLLGTANFSAPGSESPVPLTQMPNTASLFLGGMPGNGFRFGSNEPFLDVERRLTLECYAQLEEGFTGRAILLDRYNEANAPVDGVWRFGIGLSSPGSLDFILNDGDANSGYEGRLHIATAGGAAPGDGAFHHYAAVVDLQEASMLEKVRIYRDGNPLPVAVIHDDGESNYNRLRMNSDLPVTVGARSTAVSTADVVPGRVDEVRLSAGALTPDLFLHPQGVAVEDWALY